jgi:type II secretory pathway pseudopilin PulG
VEILVVLLIIGLVSVLVLPTVVSSLDDREINEAARLLQACLAGARDSAIHHNAPSGIRLLPDPVINGINPSTGLLDPAFPLAASRIIPIEPAPEYSEGFVNRGIVNHLLKVPYPGARWASH